MTARPSDAAIAAAFWEVRAITQGHYDHSGRKQSVMDIERRATELDRAQGDAALGELPRGVAVMAVGHLTRKPLAVGLSESDIDQWDDYAIEPLYTADQMRAYALAAVGDRGRG